MGISWGVTGWLGLNSNKGIEMKQWISSNAHLCENCEEKVPTQVCNDCNQRLCLECGLMHPKIKQSRHHNVVDLRKENDVDNNVEDDNYDEDIVELDASNDPYDVGVKTRKNKVAMDRETQATPHTFNDSSDLEEVDELLYNSVYHRICAQIMKYLPGVDKKGHHSKVQCCHMFLFILSRLLSSSLKLMLFTTIYITLCHVHTYIEADLQTVLTSLGIALSVHVVSKFIFGRMVSITYVIVGIVMYKFFSKMQMKYR